VQLTTSPTQAVSVGSCPVVCGNNFKCAASATIDRPANSFAVLSKCYTSAYRLIDAKLAWRQLHVLSSLTLFVPYRVYRPGMALNDPHGKMPEAANNSEKSGETL